MWFKKKANINGYNPNTAVDGTDWRTNSLGHTWPVSYTLPSAADAGNYFYLPSLGNYYSGQLYYVGNTCGYWSSSGDPHFSNHAFYLSISGSDVGVGNDNCDSGYRVDGGFE